MNKKGITKFMHRSDDQKLIAFLKGERANGDGVTLHQLWLWSNEQLERGHTYIQWMFPTKQRSQYHLLAPVMRDCRLYCSPEIQQALRRSLDVMMRFYGFAFEAGRYRRAVDFEQRAAQWITRRNHNFLRITRILTCLRLCGLSQEAELVFSAMEDVYRDYAEIIGEKTFHYWKQTKYL